MKAHNNGLHLHASSFSGSAMVIEENAARATCEVGAQVKPEPFGALMCNYPIGRHGGALRTSGIGAYEVAWWDRSPLRRGTLLRRQLMWGNNESRLAREEASAPACCEEERESAEVPSIHLAMSRPIEVTGRRIAAAEDVTAAAAVVAEGPCEQSGLEVPANLRRRRAIVAARGRSSCGPQVEGAAVRGGHLPGLSEARMSSRRAAWSRDCRSAIRSETDGCAVEAPTRRAPPWPRRRLRAVGAEQANATDRPWSSRARRRAGSITVVRATFEGGRQLIRKPLGATKSAGSLSVEVSRLRGLKQHTWLYDNWRSLFVETARGWTATLRLSRREVHLRRGSLSEAGGETVPFWICACGSRGAMNRATIAPRWLTYGRWRREGEMGESVSCQSGGPRGSPCRRRRLPRGGARLRRGRRGDAGAESGSVWIRADGTRGVLNRARIAPRWLTDGRWRREDDMRGRRAGAR